MAETISWLATAATIVVASMTAANLGSRMRRLPWNQAKVEDEKVTTRLSLHEFDGLDDLPRDEWPGR